MSVEATSWAWRQPVRGTKKLVLLCLADWADPLHRSWHATGELADRVGVTQGDEGSVLDRQEVEEVARGPVDVGDLSRKLDLDEHDVHDCLLLLVEEASAATSRLQGELIAKPVNEGFSKTVNVGLRQALEAGQDAVLVNADVEFIDSGWLDVMRARVGEDDAPASVVGARLLYPNGLIQHGGIFFSLLHRVFDHRFRYAPADLPEALYAVTAPVTGALQLIRHEALTEVGLTTRASRWASRTSTSACGSSSPGARVSTSRPCGRSTTRACSAGGRHRRSPTGSSAPTSRSCASTGRRTSPDGYRP